MPEKRPANPPVRVDLRSVDRGDLPALYRFQLDPDSNRMAAVIPRGEAAFSAVWEKSLSEPGATAWAIIADGTLVGSIACFKMDGLDAVGYWIAKEHWGRGIATRALALLLEVVAVRPLHARADRHNVASIRVLERCGFVVTGYRLSPGDARYLECEEAMLILG